MTWRVLNRRARLLALTVSPVLATVLVLAPAATHLAWAEGARVADAAAVAKTKATAETIDRARRAFDTGHGEEATALLEDAYQAGGDPALLLELGELRWKLGRDVEAKRVFEAYLKRAPGSPARASVERRLREIEMGRTKPITVTPFRPASASAPASPAPTPPAQVEKESPVFGPAPPPRPTPSAVVEGPAPPPRAATPEIPPASPSPASPAPASPAPASPAPAPALVAPSPSPVASPEIPRNGEPPPTPFVAAPPSVPTPSLSTSSSTTTSASASLVESSRRPDDAELPLPRWVPWTGAAVTVGLLTGAVFTGLAAGRQYDQLKGSCGATVSGCSRSEIDGVRNQALTANVLWGAALVVGAATGVAVYVDAHQGGVSRLWTF